MTKVDSCKLTVLRKNKAWPGRLWAKDPERCGRRRRLAWYGLDVAAGKVGGLLDDFPDGHLVAQDVVLVRLVHIVILPLAKVVQLREGKYKHTHTR